MAPKTENYSAPNVNIAKDKKACSAALSYLMPAPQQTSFKDEGSEPQRGNDLPEAPQPVHSWLIRLPRSAVLKAQRFYDFALEITIIAPTHLLQRLHTLRGLTCFMWIRLKISLRSHNK